MIFIDTGPFLARYMQSDQYHERALAEWAVLSEGGEKLFTSSLVLVEFFTLFARRDSYRAAAARARNILSSGGVEIMRSTTDDDLEAVRLFEKFADQKVGFTDCVSFALMRRRGIGRVFTFDRHFEHAGFRVVAA